MLSKIWSAAIVGLDAVPVEVDIASQEDVDELVGHYNALKRYWEMVGGMKRYQKLANKAGEGTLRKDILNNLPSDHALIDAISNLAIYEPIVRSKIAAIHNRAPIINYICCFPTYRINIFIPSATWEV